MASRLELQEVLCDLLGSKNVYFNPPESVKLVYPCIVYNLSDIDIKFADDISYNHTKCYETTIIDKDPDSGLVDKMIELPMCRFVRQYKADNLNHFLFSLYF